MLTLAPWERKRRAIPRPIPVRPPVMAIVCGVVVNSGGSGMIYC